MRASMAEPLLMEEGSALLNNTQVNEAIHYWNGTPEGKLAQILGAVCFTAFILALLIILGSSRRRCKNEILRFLIQAAYYLSFISITYTMGQIHLAPFNNEFFPCWGMVLLIVYGSADSISSFNLEDNDQWKKHAWEYYFQMYLMGRLFGLYYYKKKTESISLMPFLIYAIAYKASERISASQLATKRGMVRMTKPVAYLMNYDDTLSENVNPNNMTGCRYIMSWENEHEEELVKGVIPDEVITVEKVWQCPGRLLRNDRDPNSKLKDICLSFALYKLLCCRFAGYPLPESSPDKMWRFVRNGLLGQEGGGYSERPFRVIEQELAFLYDIFYTKYALIFDNAIYRLSIDLLILLLGCCIAFVTLWDPSETTATITDTYLHIFTSGGYHVDAIVTVIVLSVVIFSVIIQILLFVFSNWGKIIFLSKYVRNPSLQQSEVYETVVKFACRIPRPKPWGRKLGQYSFLTSFSYKPCLLLNIYYAFTFVEDPGRKYKESSPVEVSEAVKNAVVAWIRGSDRILTKGIRSLRGNGVEDELSWACKEFATHTEVIMIWHIATSLCENEPDENQRQDNDNRHRQVATDLSKYCAYLAAFAPRLLPDHAYVTECKFKEIVKIADESLNGCRTMEAKYDKLKSLAGRDHGGSVIVAGARLANQLIQRPETVWKILADFWTEMILFVAPSDDITAHAEYLARGGEFVTHLWALLFHAGIVNTPEPEEGGVHSPEEGGVHSPIQN